MARSSGAMICSMSRSRCEGDSRASCFSRMSRGWQRRGLSGLVVAPFDLPALGGLRVAGVAHIGRIALVAQERESRYPCRCPRTRCRGPKKGQRMVDRHHRPGPRPPSRQSADPRCRRRPRHDRHESCRAAVTTPLMWPFSTISDCAGVLAKLLSLPVFSAASTSLPATVWLRGMTKPGVRIEQPAHHLVFLDQRKQRLDLGRRGHNGRGCRKPWPKTACAGSLPSSCHRRCARPRGRRCGRSGPSSRRNRSSIAWSRPRDSRGWWCSRSPTRAPVEPISVGTPDLSMPTMSSHPRSIRWWADGGADDTAEPDDDDLCLLRKLCH